LVIQSPQLFRKVEFNLIDGQNNAVAEWEDEENLYRIYHDSTGSLSFQENLAKVDLPKEDGYLYRQGKVVKKWQEVAEEALGVKGTDQLWGGRPDILLEKYRKSETKENELSQVFIGEVKYTENPDYAAQGLKELLEYLAFVKENDKYFSNSLSFFASSKLKGALFTDKLELDQPGSGKDRLAVYQFGEDFKLPKGLLVG